MRQMKKRTSPARARRARNRRAGRGLLLRNWTLVAKCAAAMGCVGALYAAHLSGALHDVGQFAMRTSHALGLSVQEIYVTGRGETKPEMLLEALAVKRGDPILKFDPHSARERVNAIGWVRDSRVERRLPDTVHVALSERSPIAIWQRQGRFVLIDAEGAVIGSEDVGRFPNLKIVVGEDAPKHASELIAMLRGEPDLMARLTHAVRVSSRRWNLHLAGGIEVRLPTDGAAKAWRKLAQMEREHRVLTRDIVTVDLRVADRFTVRLNPDRVGLPEGAPREGST